MRLAVLEEAVFLEHNGASIRLDGRDRMHVLKMTPLGRKVYFGNKGKELRARRRDDPVGLILLEWSRLPAREWAFPYLVEMP
jgi:hypothetical protein